MGDQPMTRVGRPYVVLATIRNPAAIPAHFELSLQLPEDVTMIKDSLTELTLEPGQKQTLRWTITSSTPLYEPLQLVLSAGDAIIAAARLPVRFLPAMEPSSPSYIPEPVSPPKGKILVGAHHCPLWERDSYARWSQLMKHPERTPALGFYAQENPEVSDWETKWASEHGIDFFIYCWYRASEGGPVEQRYGSALHEAFFNSKFQDKMKFTIMWENQGKDRAGVADEDDLFNNLLPFWIENYFKHPSYLKVDNKPLLFIYVPGRMWGPTRGSVLDDLGSEENVKRAFDRMREECRKVGFDGLTILGEYRGSDPAYVESMKNMGFDYTFAYCWHINNSPSPQEAIDGQMEKIRTVQGFDILPQVTTVGMGWSGWKDEGSIWQIPPTGFEALLRQAKAFVEEQPQDRLDGTMLILDNWNEWGEGHYLSPQIENGFGHLDAVRKVFTDAPDEHVDLIPEDVGRASYETAYRDYLEEKRKE